MFKTAVILAGGEGTRMRPLTKYVPKALVEVDGQPLIYKSISLLQRQNVENILLTYNYLGGVLFNHLDLVVDGFINTINQDNSYFLFNSVIKCIDEPIIVMPCDIEVDIPLDLLYNDYRRNHSPAIMLVGTTPVEGVEGDFIDADDYNVIQYLSRIEKKPLYCSGIQIINPKMLNTLLQDKMNLNAKVDKNNFYDVWDSLMGTQNLKVSSLKPTSWVAYDNLKQVI